MKFKKLTAVLLSAATLAAMPVTPVLRDVWQDTAITAEAADAIIAYINVDKILYAIYQKNDTNKTRYAVTIASETDITNVVIPATVSYDGKAVPVTKIGDSTFASRYHLNTVDLSVAKNLTSIGQNAFRYSSVSTVFISGTRAAGSNLTIGKYAFADTNSLNSVTIQATVKSVTLQEHAFERSSITQFLGYAPTIVFAKEVFWRCMSLNYVRFNSNVKTLSLGDSLFFKLNNLKTLKIEGTDTTVYLGKNTFSNCGISTLSLPNTVTSIPEGCFSMIQLTDFTMPDSVKSIGPEAFAGAILPSTFKISKNVVSISDNAFYGASGESAFSIDSSNSYYKTVNGVLYNKSGTKLICYPNEKTNSTFTCSAKYYPDGCIANNRYLKTLTLKNYAPYSNGGTVTFPYLTNLENLNVPSSLDGTKTLTYFHKLFPDTKLHKINGKELLCTPDGEEPYFHKDYADYICANFDQFIGNDIITKYNDKMEDWVVSQVVRSTDRPIHKILRLRKWIMERTTYDPRVLDDENFHDDKNHCTASVFLHKETINKVEQYVTVCEGYAECFTGLLKKAGIDAKTAEVPGVHAWNLVKLNGKWYHMDLTWDDQVLDHPEWFPGSNPYVYCFAPDSQMDDPDDGHSEYDWFVPQERGFAKGKSVAVTDIRNLGDVNEDGKFDSADVTLLKTKYNTTNAKYLALCDLNFDGKVTSSDATLLNNYIKTYYKTYATPRLWRFADYEI